MVTNYQYRLHFRWYYRFIYVRWMMEKYYEFSDGWFTYYVNVETGHKKFVLDDLDVLVESNLDDFNRKCIVEK